MSESKTSSAQAADPARLVLDADVFLAVESARLREELGKTGPWPIVITDVVWSELVDYCPTVHLAGMKELLSKLAGSPTELLTQTPEALALGAMQQAAMQKEGMGELSVIAFTLHNADASAVLKDRRAVVRAVEEMRGRVLSFHGMLDWLVRQEHLPLDLAQRLSAQYLKANNGTVRPLWWPQASLFAEKHDLNSASARAPHAPASPPSK